MTEVSQNILSTHRVHRLHHLAIERHGGDAGLRSEGCIDGVLGGALTNTLYRCDLDDPDRLDALVFGLYCFQGVSTHHCYVDGNKRTAWLSLLEILQVGCGLTIEAPDDDVVTFCLTVADQHLTIEQIAEWVFPRLVPAAFVGESFEPSED